MKNILCFGDSNTWGYVPGSMNVDLMLATRLHHHERWPGILNELLGYDNYRVIEAGLNGRTTALDEKDRIRASRNGLATLPCIIEMHYPLDIVILMLGTNDCKAQYKANASDITNNMAQIIDYIQQSHFGQYFNAPKVMLICPAPIRYVDTPSFTQHFNHDSIVISQSLHSHYSKLAAEKHCYYLNAAEIVNISEADGVHIEKDSQRSLAQAISNLLRQV